MCDKRINMKYEFMSDEEIQNEAIAAIPPKRKIIKRSEDARFWKPTVNNPQKEYKSLVRVLPRNPNGRGGYCVPQHVHYIKENINGKDVFLTIKCRETLGRDAGCPICAANRALYKTQVPANIEKAKSRSANVTYIGNFLIVKDLMRPEFNNQVKLWEHRKFMNDMIMAPILTGVDLIQSTEFDAVPVMEKFTPYSPISGHNLIVHMNVNPKNNIPSYENSRWEKLSSDISTNPKLMDYIFENIINLDEFMDDVPSEQEILQKYQDFNDRLAQAGSDPGVQTGYVQGGFGAGFAGQTANIHPAAAAVIPGFGQQAPAPVAGFNATSFQKPSVTEGNSNEYFNNAMPSTNINYSSNSDVDNGDDLPF